MAANKCATLHSYRFRARGGFVSFVPSTTPGAAPTDGVLTVRLRHVRRWASRRFLRSLAAPLNLPRRQSFTLAGTPVHFGHRVAGGFAAATSKDIVRVHGLLTAPARGCPGTYTLTLKRVFVTRVLPHHVRRHHHRAAAKRS